MERNVALVTGACINTGVAIAEKFAAEGWDVVFTGRDEAKVSAAQTRYAQKFPNVRFYGYVLPSLAADGSDIADGVWYFAAHARNTTGAELVIDGGNTAQLYPVIPENAR